MGNSPSGVPWRHAAPIVPLEMYCSHAALASVLSQVANAFNDEGIDRSRGTLEEMQNGGLVADMLITLRVKGDGD